MCNSGVNLTIVGRFMPSSFSFCLIVPAVGHGAE